MWKNTKNITPCKIHMDTRISFKEIQHYIAQDKEATQRHMKAVRDQRESDKEVA